MRWVTRQRTTVAFVVALALLCSGCGAVLRAAAENPAALAFLPVAAAAEIIQGVANNDESRKPSTGMISMSVPNPGNAPLAYRYWEDPDDWVAECDGPMLCDEHEHFSCKGTPGDCYCDCVGNLASVE